MTNYEQNESKPLISVLMNCFNGEKYVHEAIQSLINQSYENWELIFWDNQSCDSSAKICKEFNDSRIHYFYSKKHTCLGDARIEALKKAKGSWVGFLDVDDIWCSNKLQDQVSKITSSASRGVNLGLIYGRVEEINKTGEVVREILHPEYVNKKLPSGNILTDLLVNDNFIVSPSILFNMIAFKKMGGFPSGFLDASDYYLSCAIASSFKVDYVNRVIAKYREHENNLSLIQKVVSYEEKLKIFNKWVKYTNLETYEVEKREKEINAMILLMKIKYDSYFSKGLFEILSRRLLFTVLKILMKNLYIRYQG